MTERPGNGNMKRRRIRIIAAALVAAGLALAGVGEAYRRTGGFIGEICVERGAVERIVVRRSEKRPFPAPMGVHWDVSGPDVPCCGEALREHLDAKTAYDVAPLPFVLRLDAVTVLDRPGARDTLAVAEPESKTTQAVRAGSQFSVGGTTVEVLDIRKWSGLIRTQEGTPMAAVSLGSPEGDWTEPIFLASSDWQWIEPDLALHLSWYDTEQAARETRAKGIGALGAARWGIVDGGRVSWFSSFAPGEGMDRADGTSVILLDREDAHAFPSGPGPAIRVGFIQGEQKRARWVPVNERNDDADVRFEDPALRPAVLVFLAWRDGFALLDAYSNGKSLGTYPMNEGDTCHPEGLPYSLKLDQVMSAAVPVALADSPLYEILLRTPAGELRLRQGESIEFGDARFEFQHEVPPPRVRYVLAALSETSQVLRRWTLDPGDVVQWRGWSFRQGQETHEAADQAILQAERVSGISLMLSGAGTAACGILLLLASFWMRTEARPSERASERL